MEGVCTLFWKGFLITLEYFVRIWWGFAIDSTFPTKHFEIKMPPFCRCKLTTKYECNWWPSIVVIIGYHYVILYYDSHSTCRYDLKLKLWSIRGHSKKRHLQKSIFWPPFLLLSHFVTFWSKPPSTMSFTKNVTNYGTAKTIFFL